MDFLFSLPLLSIHVFSVLTTLLLVIIADVHGLLWMSGHLQVLPKKRMRFFHIAVWIGLAVTITAGALMFSTYSAYLLSLPAFRLKMLFVAMLVINAFLIEKHMNVATYTPFAQLPKREKILLIVSGCVSVCGWIGAYTVAHFLS